MPMQREKPEKIVTVLRQIEASSSTSRRCDLLRHRVTERGTPRSRPASLICPLQSHYLSPRPLLRNGAGAVKLTVVAVQDEVGPIRDRAFLQHAQDAPPTHR